jgi:hypothetical protein
MRQFVNKCDERRTLMVPSDGPRTYAICSLEGSDLEHSNDLASGAK